jgi:hypothetical protein
MYKIFAHSLTAAIIALCFASGFSKTPKKIAYHTYENWTKKCFGVYGLKGDAKKTSLFHTNELKNSFESVSSTDPNVTLSKIAKTSNDDTKRFTEGTAVEVTGYVFDVVPGGSETCNCHAKEKDFNDTHIALVTSLANAEPSKTIVIEVTPQIRHYMDSAKHIDWTTNNLRKMINKKIRVKGFLLFDKEHTNAAMNTNPSGNDNWRKTCWEVHPITSIEVLKSNGAIDNSFSSINGQYTKP